MHILKPAKVFLGLSATLAILSAILLVIPGPKLSIDFTGGTMMEITPAQGVSKEQVRTAVDAFKPVQPLGNVAISATRGGSVLLRMRDLSNEEHLALLEHLQSQLGELREDQFTTIGPTVGANLKRRAVYALTIASIAIVLYLAFAFRKVPRSLSPWKFGLIAVITLLHDVLITVGIFVIISHVTAYEIDTLFVTALLIILGYSVNDTIVIFDRIRDNLFASERREEFSIVAERGVTQSLRRSINTSASTLIMLLALFLLGSESIRWFILTLIVGTMIGTYSSLFLATPLLVYWRKPPNR